MEFEAIKARVRALKTDLFWGVVSLLVLVVCLYYPYVAVSPQELRFSLNSNWEVFSAEPCPAGADCLRVGDRVLALGSVDFEHYQRDRTVELLSGVDPDGTAVVRLLRGGKILTLRVPVH